MRKQERAWPATKKETRAEFGKRLGRTSLRLPGSFLGRCVGYLARHCRLLYAARVARSTRKARDPRARIEGGGRASDLPATFGLESNAMISRARRTALVLTQGHPHFLQALYGKPFFSCSQHARSRRAERGVCGRMRGDASVPCSERAIRSDS